MYTETGEVLLIYLIHGRLTLIGKDKLGCRKESAIAGYNDGYHGIQEVMFSNLL